MNYSAVAPPSQPGSSDPQSAFADALARARQIAAKINQPSGAELESSNPLKRPYTDSFPDSQQPDLKKLANDPITDQLRAIADQQRASQAAQAAAAAASQINAKLGITSTQPPPQLPAPSNLDMFSGTMPQPHMGGGGGGGPHAGGMGMVSTEDYSVPDRMVGLIIGKGGEQIASIQSETGCKVQFAPDSAGMPDRPCTLTGTADAIIKARETIERIISKGQGLPDGNNFSDGQQMTEVLIPGNKVGLVIGKGGETIKNLQEQAGVKMVMIQDSNIPSHQDKPLRITGSMHSCSRAKELVMDLIAEKDMQDGERPYDNDSHGGGGGGGRGGFDEYQGGGGGGRHQQEIPVPRSMVGVVIGRGGEMIKKIQADTGAKVQFKTDDGQGPDRMCTVAGGPDKVQQATSMIRELIDNAMQNDRGRGRGRGRGENNFNDRGPPGGGRERFGNGGGSFGGGQDETNFTVPAEKCGLVIGKGGETIREINRQSGAHVELHRQQSANPRERVFKIQGNPDQIQTAIRLISEKAGVPPGGGQGGGPGQGGPPGGGFGGDNGQFGGYGNQPMQNQQYGQQNQAPQPPQQQQPQQNFAPQGWGNAYQQWNQASPQDPKAAVNPQTGQPDYSAAWAEYYRQQGMHFHAQAILQQAPSGGGPPGQAPQ